MGLLNAIHEKVMQRAWKCWPVHQSRAPAGWESTKYCEQYRTTFYIVFQGERFWKNILNLNSVFLITYYYIFKKVFCHCKNASIWFWHCFCFVHCHCWLKFNFIVYVIVDVQCWIVGGRRAPVRGLDIARSCAARQNPRPKEGACMDPKARATWCQESCVARGLAWVASESGG